MIGFLSSIAVGVLTGIYSSLVTLKYSHFIECKNRLVDAIRHSHTQVFVLSSTNYNGVFHELFATFDVIAERLHNSGHVEAVAKIGNIKTDILTLKNQIEGNMIQHLAISDRFKMWLKTVNSLPANNRAFFKPILFSKNMDNKA